ncbi:MAG: hypothetical protein HKM95_07720 [Inquilinus sp.]|nr:hypothetical protein [Inquilinus sp.]
MQRLPYRATTASGDVFDIGFPLHEQTGSAVRVAQLLTAVLGTLDRDIGVVGETSNGDVLQALAMAMAVRSGMIHAPREVTGALASRLLGDALAAMDEAERIAAPAGHA